MLTLKIAALLLVIYLLFFTNAKAANVNLQDLNIPIQFLMLVAYVVTAFYIWQQTEYLAKQQKPDLEPVFTE